MSRWTTELQAENSTNSRGAETEIKISRKRLATLAVELGCRLDDLLAWYADDMAAIAIMPMDQLRFIVRDYLENRDFYRLEK